MFPRAVLVWLSLAGCAAAEVNSPGAASTTASRRIATDDEITLLTTAVEKTAADLPRWAYTESRVVRDEKGKVKNDVLIRYDPSKPYPEQWTPLAVRGNPPTAADLQKYRRMGERAQRLVEHPSADRRKSLGEVIDLRNASILGETARELVFDVPLKKDGNNRFPADKFEVLVRINRTTRALENIAVRLRDSFRSKLIVKIKSGGGTLDFAPVDAKFPPTLTLVVGDASASVFFVSIGGQLELKRSDFKHVKPYDERFEVQIGTLKAIDF